MCQVLCKDKNTHKNQVFELLYHWAQRIINNFSGCLVFCCPSSGQSKSHNLLGTDTPLKPIRCNLGLLRLLRKKYPLLPLDLNLGEVGYGAADNCFLSQLKVWGSSQMDKCEPKGGAQVPMSWTQLFLIHVGFRYMNQSGLGFLRFTYKRVLTNMTLCFFPCGKSLKIC